ncbi:glycosyltransferase [Polynucleobacter sp. MWH-UH35A]|uniref:glycosyltransferase n=1 Tax=Polynucleobacter sp. MWH-UH35A TaxID=1855619 RepID=UPI00352F147B
MGGIEQTIDQIARTTAALGIENTFLTLSNSPSERPTPLHGYELITAKRDFELASNGFSWQSINLFKGLAAKADVIHYHFPWPFADFIHHWTLPNKPCVVTYHSDIVRQKLLLQLYRPLKLRFLNSVDHIVATSPNYLQTSSVLQSFADKTSVIPIGLDHQTYPKPCATLINYYKQCFGEQFFLFIGAFRYYKGLKFLIEAAREAPYPIVIVGSGPLEDELKADTLKYQLKNIFFVGQVSEENKSALLEACYGIIFPSHLRSEAFGVTLLEGAMFSKPLISCEIGTGTTYININQETGIVTPPADPKALANAMTWLWNHPEEAKKMGERARKRYEALFTAKRMSQSYFELYQKLLNY